MPFGIPCTAETVAAVQSVSNGVNDVLGAVVQDLAAPLASTLTDCESTANAISQQLLTKLAMAAGGAAVTIDQIQSALSESLQDVIDRCNETHKQVGPEVQRLVNIPPTGDYHYVPNDFTSIGPVALSESPDAGMVPLDTGGVKEAGVAQVTVSPTTSPVKVDVRVPVTVYVGAESCTSNDSAPASSSVVKELSNVVDDAAFKLGALLAGPQVEAAAKAVGVRTDIHAVAGPHGLTTLNCPALPVTLAHGIPLPGSQEFCVAVPALTQLFTTIGETLISWASSELTPEHLAQLIEQALTSGVAGTPLTGLASGIIAPFMRALHVVEPYYQVIRDTISCVWGWYSQLTPQLQPSAAAGVLMMRSVLRALEKVRLGTDALLWLTADIHIEIPPLERTLDYMLAYFAPVEAPTPAEATEAWLRNRITPEQRDCIYQLHGLAPSTMGPFALSRGEQITTSEAIQYVRRLGGGAQAERAALRKLGWVDDAQAAAAQELYWEIPTITDHLHWLQRNVFDTAYVHDYDLLQGFAEKFWPRFGKDLTTLGMKEEYAQLHYAAHWIQPSATQMREYVYRLRSGAPGMKEVFTPEDYERLLIEQDVAPRARKWARETLYRVPALTYLRDMHRDYLLDDAQLQSYHQDLGFTLSDSEHFVQVDGFRRARMRASQGHGWTPAGIAHAYACQQLDAGDVRQLMTRLHYDARESSDLMARANADLQYSVFMRARSKLLSGTVAQVEAAVGIGVMDTREAARNLVGLGWPEQQATAVATLMDTRARTKRVAETIRVLKGAYHRGEIDATFTEEQLRTIGVHQEAINGYLSLWKLQQTPHRKRRGAARIVADVAGGHLDTASAAAQLEHLGYDDADQRLYLADAASAMIHTDAAEMAAQALSGKAADAELLSVAGRAQGLSRKVVAQLKAHAPPSRLMTWYCRGIVGANYVRRRLSLYGWDDPTIEAWLLEAESKKKCEPDYEAPDKEPGSERAGVAPAPAEPIP